MKAGRYVILHGEQGIETAVKSCVCQKHLRAGVSGAVMGLKQRHVGLCMRGELMKVRLELAFARAVQLEKRNAKPCSRNSLGGEKASNRPTAGPT